MGGLDFSALDWVIELLGIKDVETLIHDLQQIQDTL